MAALSISVVTKIVLNTWEFMWWNTLSFKVAWSSVWCCAASDEFWVMPGTTHSIWLTCLVTQLNVLARWTENEVHLALQAYMFPFIFHIYLMLFLTNMLTAKQWKILQPRVGMETISEIDQIVYIIVTIIGSFTISHFLWEYFTGM